METQHRDYFNISTGRRHKYKNEEERKAANKIRAADRRERLIKEYEAKGLDYVKIQNEKYRKPRCISLHLIDVDCPNYCVFCKKDNLNDQEIKSAMKWNFKLNKPVDGNIQDLLTYIMSNVGTHEKISNTILTFYSNFCRNYSNSLYSENKLVKAVENIKLEDKKIVKINEKVDLIKQDDEDSENSEDEEHSDVNRPFFSTSSSLVVVEVVVVVGLVVKDNILRLRRSM